MLSSCLQTHAGTASSLASRLPQARSLCCSEEHALQLRACTSCSLQGREQFDEITDKHIPVRPLGVVEGTSYSLVIAAGLACCGAIVYTAVNSLLVQPKQYTVFNMALEKLRHDPRVTVRLGEALEACSPCILCCPSRQQLDVYGVHPATSAITACTAICCIGAPA